MKRVIDLLTRGLVLGLVMVMLAIFVGIRVNAKDNNERVEGELLIKVSSEWKNKIQGDINDTKIENLNKLFKEYEVKGFNQLLKVNKNSKKDAEIFLWYKINVNQDKLENLKEKLERELGVISVEYDYIATTNIEPNDPYYSSSGLWGQSYSNLWGLHKINVSSAWDKVTDTSNIVVASIDTGIDVTREEIKNNIWVNLDEIAGNMVDDDLNGYIDDVNGWNWIMNASIMRDDNGHGTHTSGTIMAEGNNNLGVVGMNWKGKIMALKFLDRNGNGTVTNGVRALQYAAENGAKVSNNSWGCRCNSALLDDALKYEHDMGMVIVASAGNDNADSLDYSPASSELVVTVGATDYEDNKASFSNWGRKLDVMAPGVNILSLLSSSGGDYCFLTDNCVNIYAWMSGTSMSAPHVSGLVALMWANNPSLTNEEIRQILRSSSVDVGEIGRDTNYGFGRIDAASAMEDWTSRILTPVINAPLGKQKYLMGNIIKIYGGVSGENYQSYILEIGVGRNPISWNTVSSSTNQPENELLGELDTTALGEGYFVLRLVAQNIDGKKFYYEVNDISINNIIVKITQPLNLDYVYVNKIQPISVEVQTSGSTVQKTEIEVTNGGKYTYRCTDTIFPYSCNWKVPSHPGYIYRIRATAYVLGGNFKMEEIYVTAKK